VTPFALQSETLSLTGAPPRDSVVSLEMAIDAYEFGHGEYATGTAVCVHPCDLRSNTVKARTGWGTPCLRVLACVHGSSCKEVAPGRQRSQCREHGFVWASRSHPLDKWPQFLEDGLRHAREDRVRIRTLRAHMVGVQSPEEYRAKVHCLRVAFDRLFARKPVRKWFQTVCVGR
jgi:hypothetical protein